MITPMLREMLVSRPTLELTAEQAERLGRLLVSYAWTSRLVKLLKPPPPYDQEALDMLVSVGGVIWLIGPDGSVTEVGR